jgi:release factor glutamine methyltransferase
LASATSEWTTRRILDWTNGYLKEHGSESPRLEAELLLAHACGWPRIQLYTRFDEVVPEDVRARMRDLVKRRGNAEPVAYLIGYREFFSLKFEVGPGVFIPRPETETLVIEALAALKTTAAETNSERPQRVLDLCTGSGCIAISVAVNAPGAQVVAIEQSPAAMEFTRRNASRHKVEDRVEIREGDLFSEVAGDEIFDVIASNPPYVTKAEIEGLQADVRKFEPHAALDGGEDGLDIVRRIAERAPSHLIAGGFLMMEISPEQADTTLAIFQQAGFESLVPLKDLSGVVRVIRGRRGS